MMVAGNQDSVVVPGRSASANLEPASTSSGSLPVLTDDWMFERQQSKTNRTTDYGRYEKYVFL